MSVTVTRISEQSAMTSRFESRHVAEAHANALRLLDAALGKTAVYDIDASDAQGDVGTG